MNPEGMVALLNYRASSSRSRIFTSPDHLINFRKMVSLVRII